MSALFLHGNKLPPIPRFQSAKPIVANTSEVIVISDDEDDIVAPRDSDIIRNDVQNSNILIPPPFSENDEHKRVRRDWELIPPQVQDLNSTELLPPARHENIGSPTRRKSPFRPRLGPKLETLTKADNSKERTSTLTNIRFHPKIIIPKKEPDVDVTRDDVFDDPFSAHNLSSPNKTKHVAPYYDDQKLSVRMFRGPGYEQFPVVLGTVDGHQQICDRWDKAQAAKHEKQNQQLARFIELGTFLDEGVFGDSSEDDVDEDDAENITIFQQNCLQLVLDVLPTIQPEFVLEAIRRSSADDRMEIDPNAILAGILELESYPEQKPLSQVEQEALEEAGTGRTIRWNREIPKSIDYLKDATIILANTFEHVPTYHISRIVREKKSLFDAYLDIEETDNNYFSLSIKPYPRLRNARLSIEKKYQRGTLEIRDNAQYSDMINELQAAKQHHARLGIKEQQRKDKEKAETDNLEQHRKEGNLIECQCCFDTEIPLNRAVSCQNQDLHWFCFGCVSRLAESQVGMMKYEMKCMDSSQCDAHLSIDGVSRAVAIKTFDKLAFFQQQAEIAAAGIEGLEQCPFCDFQAICDPVEVDSVFRCQNPVCFRVTCRKCHTDSHLPKTCEQAKNDRGLSARHFVEEARSEAIMRTCPGCKTKIIKEFGCNKMRCVKCGGVMCYICKVDISKNKDGGYEHFNKQGSTCVLYDRQDVDRHEQEAKDAEEEAIKQAKEKNADLDEVNLQIDTGKPLNNRVANPNALGFGPPPLAIPRRRGAHRQHVPAHPHQHAALHGRHQQYNELIRQPPLRMDAAPPPEAMFLAPHAQLPEPRNDGAERQRLQEFRLEQERRRRAQRERALEMQHDPQPVQGEYVGGYNPPAFGPAQLWDNAQRYGLALPAVMVQPPAQMNEQGMGAPPMAFANPGTQGAFPQAPENPVPMQFMGVAPLGWIDMQNMENNAFGIQEQVNAQVEDEGFVDAWDGFEFRGL